MKLCSYAFFFLSYKKWNKIGSSVQYPSKDNNDMDHELIGRILEKKKEKI